MTPTLIELQRWLETWYPHLHGSVAQRIAEGRGLNHRIDGADGSWLLKVFQTDWGLPRVLVAAQFATFLTAAGLPVQPFVLNREGNPATPFGGRAAVVVPWIDGETMRPNTLTDPSRIQALGEVAGALHSVCQHFPEPGRLSDGRMGTLAGRLASLEELALNAAAAGDTVLVDAVDARLSILHPLSDVWSYAFAGPYEAIHGDLSIIHVVWQRDTAVGVIDAGGDCYFSGWELCRCFFQSISNIWEIDDTSAGILWRHFYEGYLAKRGDGHPEAESAFDQYFLALAASTYGLTGQITGSATLDPGLRAFGLWRTRTAIELSARRDGLLREFCRA